MKFAFNEKKAAQAAAHLLAYKGGTLDKLVLLKTLYMADRRALLEHGSLITGDRIVAMDHGLVLSEVFKLLKMAPPSTWWGKFISPPDAGDDVRLKVGVSPDTDELSRYEVRVLEEEADKYAHMEPYPLVDHLHKICPEWRQPHTAVQDVEYADILRKNGKSDAEIKSIEFDAELAYAHATLGR